MDLQLMHSRLDNWLKDMVYLCSTHVYNLAMENGELKQEFSHLVVLDKPFRDFYPIDNVDITELEVWNVTQLRYNVETNEAETYYEDVDGQFEIVPVRLMCGQALLHLLMELETRALTVVPNGMSVNQAKALAVPTEPAAESDDDF